MTEQRLPGGRSFGAVRAAGEVRRPAQPWTATVHSVLRHLEDVDWDTASPSRPEDDLAFSALTWVPLLTAAIAEPAGFGDPADRRRRFHLLLDAYGYTGDRTAVRDAILGRVERNVAVIRELAATGEPTFRRMLPWAADLERSGAEVARLPAEFWTAPR